MNERMLNALKKMAEIMAKAGETEFGDLGRKYRESIIETFDGAGLDKISDGDGDNCYNVYEGGRIMVTFWSHCEYIDGDDFAELSYDMTITGEEDEDLTITQACMILEGATPKVIGVLNTSIITKDGEYTLETITLDEAKDMINGCIIDSAVGHDSAAQILTTLLGVDIPVNRQTFKQSVGQECLVLKVNGRPQEGVILSLEEIETMGYSLKRMTRTA